MSCPVCGATLVNGSNFCTQCGNTIAPTMNNQPGIGSITIVRPKSFYGCAIAYNVSVNGYLLGKVKNGETKTFPLYYGNQELTIHAGMCHGTTNFVINDTYRNLVFQCPIKMGLLTNTIEINFIQSY